MKLIPLTKRGVNKGKYFAMVSIFDYDYLRKWNWHRSACGYAERKASVVERANGSPSHIKTHRQLLGLTDPNIFGDHKDGDGLNNRRKNIRISDHSQNCSNKKSEKNSSSKYLGVSWHKQRQKWHVNLTHNKKYVYVGLFTCEIEAAKAYDKKAIELHGEFTRPNFPTSLEQQVPVV